MEKNSVTWFVKHLLILIFQLLTLFSVVNAQPAFPLQNMVDAAEYSKDEGGASTLVLQNGDLLFEAYHNGADSSTATHLFSGTKGFWALMAAHAKEVGLLADYDEPVYQTITEWNDNTVHPGKKLITVRHLLELSSGLSQDVDQIQGLGAMAPDIYQYVVDSLRLVSLPGNQFQYGPSHYYAFGVLLERKLSAAGIDLNPLEYLDSVLLRPIGFTYSDWAHDPAGNPHIPNGCYTTSRNWVKFGQLLLQKGRWQQQQLVDSTLVEELLETEGPNPGHGKFLWLNSQGGQGAVPSQTAPPGAEGGFMYYDGYNDIIGVLGAGKNRMYIIPSLNAVVLRQTLEESDDFIDHDFLSLLLQGVATSTEELPPRPLSFSLFPNPVTDWLQVQLPEPSGWLEIQVLDVNGKRLMHQEGEQTRLYMGHLREGLYLVRVKTDQGIGVEKVWKGPGKR